MRRRDAAYVITALACLLFTVSLLAGNIVPTRKRLAGLTERSATLEADIEAERAAVEALKEREAALETDVYAVDAELRRTFRYVGPNEKVIRVVADEEK